MGLLQYSDQEKVIEWVKARYRGCPNCDTQGANIGDIVGIPIMERTIPSGIGPGQQIIWALSVSCTNCGHTSFFNSNDLKGLVKLE